MNRLINYFLKNTNLCALAIFLFSGLFLTVHSAEKSSKIIAEQPDNGATGHIESASVKINSFETSLLETNLLEKKSPIISSAKQSKDQVAAHFSQIIVDIDSTLLSKQAVLKANKQLLEDFVDSNILPYWDVDLTLRLLVGGKTWRSLNQKEIQNLRNSFNQTLQRYVREGMNYYDGQRVRLESVTLNDKRTRGLVTIELEPVYLPAFNVHFKITNDQDCWLLYDVMIEGISYVKMKKNQYRQIVKQGGVKGLMAYLDQKNIASNNVNNNNVNNNKENSKGSKSELKL